MTMRAGLAKLVVLALTLGSASAAAARPPVTNSPGDPARETLVPHICPTFSWGAVDEPDGYDLVILRLEDRAGSATLALERRFAGAVSSWTPSLDDCLEPGGSYAWSVRGRGRGKSSDWSVPRLFQVAPESSESDLGQALKVIRRHLGQRAARRDRLPVATEEREEAADHYGNASPGRESSHASASTQLTVDGNLDATSLGGDGSALTGLDSNHLLAELPIPRGGTGATDADGARTNLGIAVGPHIVDTDTNAQTACGPSQFFDGDGNCVEKVGLDDLPSCSNGDVPKKVGGTWTCGPAVILVTTPAEIGASVSVSCPSGTLPVAGGFVNPPGETQCRAQFSVFTPTVIPGGSLGYFTVDVSAMFNVVVCRIDDDEDLCEDVTCHIGFTMGSCDCLAVCQ